MVNIKHPWGGNSHFNRQTSTRDPSHYVGASLDINEVKLKDFYNNYMYINNFIALFLAFKKDFQSQIMMSLLSDQTWRTTVQFWLSTRGLERLQLVLQTEGIRLRKTMSYRLHDFFLNLYILVQIMWAVFALQLQCFLKMLPLSTTNLGWI